MNCKCGITGTLSCPVKTATFMRDPEQSTQHLL